MVLLSFEVSEAGLRLEEQGPLLLWPQQMGY